MVLNRSFLSTTKSKHMEGRGLFQLHVAGAKVNSNYAMKDRLKSYLYMPYLQSGYIPSIKAQDEYYIVPSLSLNTFLIMNPDNYHSTFHASYRAGMGILLVTA